MTGICTNGTVNDRKTTVVLRPSTDLFRFLWQLVRHSSATLLQDCNGFFRDHFAHAAANTIHTRPLSIGHHWASIETGISLIFVCLWLQWITIVGYVNREKEEKICLRTVLNDCQNFSKRTDNRGKYLLWEKNQ